MVGFTPFPPRSPCDMLIAWCGCGSRRGFSAVPRFKTGTRPPGMVIGANGDSKIRFNRPGWASSCRDGGVLCAGQLLILRSIQPH